MITIGFVLENNNSTIQECLASLSILKGQITSYVIISKQGEDLKTIRMIEEWASTNNISKVDSWSTILCIKGDERLRHIRTTEPIFTHCNYLVEIHSEEYIESEVRLNKYRVNDDNTKTIDIILDKILVDPLEYNRRAINLIIEQLGGEVDYVEIARMFRMGGDLKKSMEYLLKTTDPNKKMKYYLEYVSLEPYNAQILHEFNQKYPKAKEAIYYYSKYLIQNSMYELAYGLICNFYNSNRAQQESTRVVGIDKKLCEISLQVFEKLNKTNEYTILALEDETYRQKISSNIYVVPSGNKLEGKVCTNSYTFRISKDFEEAKKLIEITKVHCIEREDSDIDLVEYIDHDGIYKLSGGIFNYLLVIEEGARNTFLEINKLKYMNLDVSKLRSTLLFLDLDVSKTSIEQFLKFYKTNQNCIYIGLSKYEVENSMNEALSATKYLLLRNVSEEMLMNPIGVLQNISINPGDYTIIKLIKDLKYHGNSSEITIVLDKEKLESAFIINLHDRKDRMIKANDEFRDIFKLERVDAIRDTPGWVGCFKSHKRCIRIAKEKKMSSVLVLEDDCKLLNKSNFLREWSTTKKWLDSNRDKWDVFLGGCTNLKPEHVLGWLDKSQGLVSLDFSTPAHFYYCNQTIYDKIINFNIDKKTYSPFDLVLAAVGKGRIVTKIPFLAIQGPDYSDIEGHDVDYVKMFNDSYKIILEEVEKTKEKKTISPILMGGLGNRMFQIASSYGLAKEQNRDLLVEQFTKNAHSDLEYFDTIFRKVKRGTVSKKDRLVEKEGEALKYLQIPNINNNMELFGYFQNEKYFNKYRNELLELFEIEPERLQRLVEKYAELDTSYFIHFRRGDYVNNPIHDLDLVHYYKNAIDHLGLGKDTKVYVFSNDIEYCKKQEILNGLNVEFVEGLDELDSLYLMSMCKLGGIGCNSSFSWWGGYLNTNLEKRVTYPNKWFNTNWGGDIGWSGCNIISIEKVPKLKVIE